MSWNRTPVDWVKPKVQTCAGLPEPTVPKVAGSGLAFIQGTSSAKLLGGSSARPVIIRAEIEIMPIGSKSFSTS